MVPLMIIDAQEIRRRAAGIRRNWSADERRRRIGLPPDTPYRLREFFAGPRPLATRHNTQRGFEPARLLKS